MGRFAFVLLGLVACGKQDGEATPSKDACPLSATVTAPVSDWDEGWQTGYRTMRGCFAEACLTSGKGLSAKRCDGVPVYCE